MAKVLNKIKMYKKYKVKVMRCRFFLNRKLSGFINAIST